MRWIILYSTLILMIFSRSWSKFLQRSRSVWSYWIYDRNPLDILFLQFQVFQINNLILLLYYPALKYNLWTDSKVSNAKRQTKSYIYIGYLRSLEVIAWNPFHNQFHRDNKVTNKFPNVHFWVCWSDFYQLNTEENVQN